MMPMFDVQGFILVGGRSSRMGEDKARLRFGGRTGVELITGALQSVTQIITTVGWTHQAVEDLPNIPDLHPGCGPLAGIEAALRHAKSEYCLIVACDFPFVTGELFEFLVARTAGSDAVVPMQADARPQPLCALYRAENCLPATESVIAAGQYSPRALLEQVRTHYIPFDELQHLAGSKNFFFNVNTPANYEIAQRMFEERLEVRG